MYTLVWKERILGMIRIQKRTFADGAERFRFILELEKRLGRVDIVEMKNP